MMVNRMLEIMAGNMNVMLTKENYENGVFDNSSVFGEVSSLLAKCSYKRWNGQEIVRIRTAKYDGLDYVEIVHKDAEEV